MSAEWDPVKKTHILSSRHYHTPGFCSIMLHTRCQILLMASVVGAADLSLFLGQCRCDLNLLDRDPRFCYFASVPDRIDIPGFCRQDVHAALCRRSAIPAAAVRLLHACSGYLGAPCASSRSSFQPSAPWTDGGMRLRHLLHWIFVADLWKASRQASLRFQAPSLLRNTFMYLSNLAEPGLPTGLPPAGFPPGFALGPERGERSLSEARVLSRLAKAAAWTSQSRLG